MSLIHLTIYSSVIITYFNAKESYNQETEPITKINTEHEPRIYQEKEIIKE